MRLSKRTRYGLRLMFELARNYQEKTIKLSSIAQKEKISKKFLSQIAIPLKGAGLIQSSRGAYGGYSLARQPEDITIEDIVTILEGDTSLVECLHNPTICNRVSYCVTRDVWGLLSEEISTLLRSITLVDLVEKANKKQESAVFNYQI
jgi:Rrf2 family protein